MTCVTKYEFIFDWSNGAEMSLTGGSGFSRVDVADNDDVDVNFLFTVDEISTSDTERMYEDVRRYCWTLSSSRRDFDLPHDDGFGRLV